MSTTTYAPSYDVETIRCLKGVEQIVRHHRQHSVPATFFVVGELLEDRGWSDELKSLIDDPLFDIQNHSYSHIRIRFGNEVDDAFLQTLKNELSRTSDLLREVFGRDIVGFRTPMGFGDGLRGEPAILGVLWSAGIRFVSSKVTGPNNTVPAPYAEPFYYEEEDILHPVLEIPAHGWHDNVLKGYNYCPVAWPPVNDWAYPDRAPQTPDEEYAVWKRWFEHAVHSGLRYFAPIFHPWSVYRFSKQAETIGMITEHVTGAGVPVCSYRDLFTRLSEEMAV